MDRNRTFGYKAPAIAAASLAALLLWSSDSPRNREIADLTAPQSSSLEQKAEEVVTTNSEAKSENLEIKQYVVNKSSGIGLYNSMGLRMDIGKTQYLELEGKRIAYSPRTIRSYDDDKTITTHSLLVPGAVISEEYENDYGVVVIDVRPIDDPKLREKIRAKLETNGKVSFWTND